MEAVSLHMCWLIRMQAEEKLKVYEEQSTNGSKLTVRG